MEKVLMFSINVPDLVNLIANEVQLRLTNVSLNNLPEPEPEKRLNGDRAAAVHIGCTVQTVARLRKDREIPYHRYGRKYYYIGSEIDAALKVDNRRFGELRGNRSK